ncbi:MAG: fused MFS/spermidine synthase [Myxococcota bacterium]
MRRRLALWLTLPTGFAGLVYEVTWEASLATLLGSHSEAAVAVLAIFLGGLAAGYATFGRLSRARPDTGRVLALYGAVEIAIGLHALVFPALLAGARAASAAQPVANDAAAFAADVVLCALLLGPAALAMGATIPLLTQALPRDAAESTRIHARIYALNTFGATAGALCAAYWIVPALGLAGSLRAMAGVNLAAGALYLWIARGEVRPLAAADTGRATVPARAAAVALLLGFGMMTLQTSALRLAALGLGGSPFTFALVVAVFVLCIATGSALVSGLRRVPPWLLAACVGGLFAWVAGLHLFLEDVAWYGHWLRSRFPLDAASFGPYQAAVFASLLCAVGPAALLSGASLPLLFDRLRRDLPDAGGIAGRLYAWNTGGSVLGALVGGYALFWWLDLDGVYRVAAGAVAVALALLGADRRQVLGAGFAAAALAGLVWLPAWSIDRLSSGAYRVREPLPMTSRGPDAFFSAPWAPILFHDDDPSASITVKEFVTFNGQKDRNLVTNGKSDSAVLTEYATLGLGALLPALFADRLERAFVIGLGTGVTASELARLAGVEEVVVAEISAAVIEAAPWFDPLNGEASRNPRIRIVRGDAYRSLLRAEGRFDVIFSEPSNPWVAGVEMLFSREFLAQGRRRLAPGGVYAQWLQLYEIDPPTLALALRTFGSVFQHVSVWYGDGPDLLVLGHDRPDAALDLARLARRSARDDFRAGLARAGVPNLPALLAHELMPLGTVQDLFGEGPLHTLMHPRLRHAAARAFHVGRMAPLPRPTAPATAERAERNSLWRRYRRARGTELSEAERSHFARQMCQHRYHECAPVLAEWAHEVPRSPARLALRRDLLARSKRRGQGAPPFARVPALSRLFLEDAMLPRGREGVKQAREDTRLWVDYYHPAAPFSRTGLRSRWARCREDWTRRDACAEALRAVEASLGPLGLAP